MKKNFWIVVKGLIEKVDIVLEVLDARMPELTRNIKLEDCTSRMNKPLILVVNKADIVSGTTIQNIRKQYHGLDCILVSSKMAKGIQDLIGVIKSKVKKEKIKVVIIGYPNTGKSTLINRLSKGARAGVSPESGFTKGMQFIAGKANLLLIDTPGVVPYEGRDEILLGIMAGISPSKLDDPDLVAYEILKTFKINNPSAIKEAYGIDTELEPEDMLVEFGKKNNLLIKGGLADERRAAIKLINDWHRGKIRL